MDIIGAGANSLSIVGKLSTLGSVHYQRFHCIFAKPSSCGWKSCLYITLCCVMGIFVTLECDTHTICNTTLRS